MQVLSLAVAAALSLGVGVADVSEGEVITPPCAPTMIECPMTTLPSVDVPAPEPSTVPTYASQAKRFFLLY